MAELNVEQTAAWTGAKILQGRPSLRFTGYSIDSRRVKKGELFFAVSGERDGHEFIEHAAQKGAAGAVVSRKISTLPSRFAVIQVDDTLAALQSLARSVLEHHPARVVGITGSAGKTTTKEFTAFLLAGSYQVMKSEGNYNNHLGLPLSVLNLQPGHEIAVLEYAMSSPGEISALTKIAPPDVAVVINVHPVHLEYFDNLNQIARAKEEILHGMKPGGTAILNQDDPLVRKMSTKKAGKVIRFGTTGKRDIKAGHIHQEGGEKIHFELFYSGKNHSAFIPFFNRSYLTDFLAAAAVSLEFSIPAEDVIARAAGLQPYEMRGCLHFPGKDIKLIDDSYNSSPAALDEALKSLVLLPGKRKIAILGDMLELGKNEIQYHLQAGRTAAEMGIDLLATVGNLAYFMAEGSREAGLPAHRVYSYKNSSEGAAEIPSLAEPGDVILVKGSRGIHMEKITDALKRVN